MSCFSHEVISDVMRRQKSARVAVVSQNTQGDSSDEENQEGEAEEPDVDDTEILEDLPDDSEVCCRVKFLLDTLC